MVSDRSGFPFVSIGRSESDPCDPELVSTVPELERLRTGLERWWSDMSEENSVARRTSISRCFYILCQALHPWAKVYFA